MRNFIIIVILYNILPVMCYIELTNEVLGDFHFLAEAGDLPPKYFPMTAQDLAASEKATDVIDFIQLVPNIDPLKREMLEPVGIDVPSLWLSGQIYMRNFMMAGIKQLDINSVEIRLKNLRTDLNISVPLVYIEGDLIFKATLSFLPLKFSCHISANLMDVDVLVSAGSKLVNFPPTGEILQIDSAAVKVDIRNVQFNLTDLEIGGEVEDVDVAARQLFSGFTDGNIFDKMLISALDMANDELLTFPADSLKSYLFDA